MPLEDLSGNKYIDDLNPDWPAGTDYPSDGDNHLRGIKNVLKKTFPALAGPVNLTQDMMNQSVLPRDTKLLFYASTPPLYWEREPNIEQYYGIKILATTDTTGGQAVAGDDPVLNNKVPNHKHVTAGYTNTTNISHTHGMAASGSHSHTGWTDVQGNHQHSLNGHTMGPGSPVSTGRGYFDRNFGAGVALTAGAHSHNVGTHAAGAHTHGIYNADPAHNHYVNLTSGNQTGFDGSASGNWAPRHMTMILCYQKSYGTT